MRPSNGQLDLAAMDAFRFPKLNRHMQSMLQAKSLWLVVTGVELCPAKPPDLTPRITPMDDDRVKICEYLDCQWVTHNGAMQVLMCSMTDELQWPHVTNCITSKGMWDTWKQVHQMNQ